MSTDNKKLDDFDIESYIKQKPNRQILGMFRFHLGVYNTAIRGKRVTRFDSLLMRIGERPVILDTLLTDKSVKQLKLFLNSKGYFNSTVSRKIK